MSNVVLSPDLIALPHAIGRASIFYAVGKFVFAAGGTDITLLHLGDTEGEVTINPNPKYSDLTLNELTGDIPHERYITGLNPTIEMPVFAADAALRDIVSPVGSRSGGYSRQRKVKEFTLAIFPEQLFLDATGQQQTLAYTKAAGWKLNSIALDAEHTALLALSIFFWRVCFDPAMPMFKHEDGGKVVQKITAQSMFNTTMPEGHKIYTAGDPALASTAIHLAAA